MTTEDEKKIVELMKKKEELSIMLNQIKMNVSTESREDFSASEETAKKAKRDIRRMEKL